jgi:hypothetical protein
MIIGGKPKLIRTTVQVVGNGKHYSKHTVYVDAATVDRLVRAALHRAITERDEAHSRIANVSSADRQ